MYTVRIYQPNLIFFLGISQGLIFELTVRLTTHISLLPRGDDFSSHPKGDVLEGFSFNLLGRVYQGYGVSESKILREEHGYGSSSPRSPAR